MAFIRARDIEDILKNRGPERGMMYLFSTLAEQQIALQQDTRRMAQALDQMSDIITAFTTVAEGMKSTIEKLNGDAAHEELGHATNIIDQ